MSRMCKMLFAAAALCALPVQSAFAQGEPGTEGMGEAGGEAGGEVGGGVAAAPEVTATPDAAIGGITAWPKEIIFRPLTLNAGMLRVEATPGAARASFAFDPLTMMPGPAVTIVGLGLSAGYGVTDKIEVGGAYGFALDEFEIKGPLSVMGKYRLMDGKMRAAAGGSVTYDLAAESAMAGAGVDFWYNVTSNLAVFTPANQIQIGIDPGSLAVNLPVGVGFQATPNIFASAATSIGTIGISGDEGSAFLFADIIPITVSAFYSPSNKMDFGAVFDTVDVGGIADMWALTLVGRMFM